jgi:hypothetical protein
VNVATHRICAGRRRVLAFGRIRAMLDRTAVRLIRESRGNARFILGFQTRLDTASSKSGGTDKTDGPHTAGRTGR